MRPLGQRYSKCFLPICDRPLVSYALHGAPESWEKRLLIRGTDSVAAEFAGSQGIDYVVPHSRARLAEVPRLLDDETHVVTFWGDTITSIDMADLFRHHLTDGNPVTMAVLCSQSRSLALSWGNLRVDRSGLVEAADAPLDRSRFHHDVGVYAFSPAMAATVRRAMRDNADEWQVIKWLIAKRLVRAYRFTGEFINVNTHDDLKRAQRRVLATDLGHPSKRSLMPRDWHLVRPAFVSTRAVISSGAVIGPWSTVEKDCFVEVGARILRSLIFPGSAIGKDARVVDSIVEGVEVPAYSRIKGEVKVLSIHVRIQQHA